MIAFTVIAIALCALAAAWLTRRLWPTGADGKSSAGLAAVLVAFMFVVASGGYVALGSPGHLVTGAGTASAPTAGEGTPEDQERTQALQQIAAMVDQLAERLKTRPDDAEGWQMLARSYAAIGRHAQAVDAFRKATQLRPDDAGLLADFAYSAATTNNRSFEGEPTMLVERALKLVPNNPKALALVAFDRKDYRVAVQHWEKLAQVEPADGQYAEQIRASIAQARQLAGMPPAAAPISGSAVAAPPPAAATGAASAQVSGTVSLAPPLKARVAPDDTVYVFARAAEGNRMPLAILRKQVKDLPLQFRLDDSMAMSPAAKLSGATNVIVGARISKSGDAMPKSGDLQGLSPAVAVGATGVKVEINEELKR